MEFMIPGLIFGYASARGRFCLNSGIADALFRADLRKVKILLVAVLLQAVFALSYFFAGEMPQLGAHNVAYVAIGGLVFGLLMPVAGGCPGGIIFKAAEGQIPAIIALGAFVSAVGVAYATPLRIYFTNLHAVQSTADLHAGGVGRMIWAIGALFVLSYLLLRTRSTIADGALWSWKISGLAIGTAAILYSLFSRSTAGVPALGFVPGFISAFEGRISPEFWFVAAVIGGSFTAAVRAGRFRLTPCTMGLCLKRLAGGFSLGLAAAVAAGCSVGYNVGFLPQLSLQALIAISAIVLGRATAELISRRAAAASQLQPISGKRP